MKKQARLLQFSDFIHLQTLDTFHGAPPGSLIWRSRLAAKKRGEKRKERKNGGGTLSHETNFWLQPCTLKACPTFPKH